jgi:hypothetical protein
MGKTGAIADIANEGIRGFMRGREIKEQRKAAQANYAIDLSNKNEQSAWQTYQDSLRTGQAKAGDVNDPAYQAYLKAHQATSETMSKVAIPEEKPKDKKKKDQQGKDKQEGPLQPRSLADGIKEFMAANPHLIPQALIAARTPNKPVMTAETEETKNKLAGQAQDLKIGQQTIASNDQKIAEQDRQLKEQAQNRAVEEAGGYQKVIEDPNASPELKQTALRMRSTYLDNAGPDAQAKFKYDQDLQNGNFKNWTQGDRLRAGALGVVPPPKEVTIERGNKAYLEYIDPITNKPIPGSVPLYVGPSSEAKEVAGFFAERGAMKNDLRKAVQDDPAAFGVQMTGDKKTDDARVNATAERLFIAKEEGLQAAMGGTGKTAYEVQRDDAILDKAMADLQKRFPKGKNADGKVSFAWPDQKEGKIDINAKDMKSLVDQFLTDPTETPNMRTFRSSPMLQQGKDAAAAERDRKFVYDMVLNTMMTMPGKKAMSREQAEAILKGTALGKPITQDDVRSNPSQTASAPKKGNFRNMVDWVAGLTGKDPTVANGLQGPPTSVQAAQQNQKMYVLNGQAIQLSDEDVQKLKTAGYSPEEISPELVQQFAQ